MLYLIVLFTGLFSLRASAATEIPCYGEDPFFNFKVVLRLDADAEIKTIVGHAAPNFSIYRDFEFTRRDIKSYVEESNTLSFLAHRKFSQNPFFPEEYRFWVTLKKNEQNEWHDGEYNYHVKRGDEDIRLGGDLLCGDI